MIRRPAWFRHGAVALTVLACAALVLGGGVGQPHHAERIEALRVLVRPSGPDGLRIEEVIDQDFGSNSRHGPELVVPEDFGTPTDVTSHSDDAPDEVAVAYVDGGLRIRVGDPDEKVTGQHRYVVAYTLAAARLTSGTLSLDAVGADSDIPIDDVDVYVAGFTLTDTTCASGGSGATGGCTLTDAGATYHVHVDHLAKREGITVGGRIRGRSGDVGSIPAHVPPAKRDEHRVPLAALGLGLGLITALAVERAAARRGSNDVVGAGAADAAFAGSVPATGAVPIRRVTDAELASMATVEFTPPPGLEPWQGAALLREKLGGPVVVAWFSGAAAKGWIEIEGKHGKATGLRAGPHHDDADGEATKVLNSLFGSSDHVSLGEYSSRFAGAWSKVATQQRKWIKAAGWWRKPLREDRGDKLGRAGWAIALVGLVPVVLVLAGAAGFVLGLLGVIGGIVGLVLVCVGGPYVSARAAYSPLLPGRTAAGSAAALRTESFRRFLVESEGQHVEWAWSQGLLRQYSAWAVALDAADAWQSAMAKASGIPPDEVAWSTPMFSSSINHAFTSASTAPSTSSSSGSSGSSFSSGSVGGGGGGGSHGSW